MIRSVARSDTTDKRVPQDRFIELIHWEVEQVRYSGMLRAVDVMSLFFGLCLGWEQKADCKAETFAPIPGLVLAALLYGQLHIRVVHQTSLQVLSERLAHGYKGIVEVRKSVCSGFRWQHFCRAHSDGYAQRALYDWRGLLQHSAVPILQ